MAMDKHTKSIDEVQRITFALDNISELMIDASSTRENYMGIIDYTLRSVCKKLYDDTHIEALHESVFKDIGATMLAK